MRRQRTLDKILFVVLVPLWLVCFGFAVKTQVRDPGLIWLGVSAPEDAAGYPALRGGVWSISHASLAASGLREGDRILCIGGADLRGAGRLEVLARFQEEAGPDHRVQVRFERAGEQRETTLELSSFSVALPHMVTGFIFGLGAIILFLRAPPSPLVRTGLYAGLCWGFALFYFGGSLREVQASFWINVVSFTLLFPLSLRFMIGFPSGVAPDGFASRVWPWSFSVLGLLAAAMPFAAGFAWAGILGVAALANTAILVIATHNYRRGDAIAKRQIKWVLFGLYCAALPVVVTVVLSLAEPRLSHLYLQSLWGGCVFAICVLVATARFNLFDVDRIISATASYNIVLVFLGAGALVLVPRGAEAASGLLGVDPAVGQVALSLVLVGVVIPAHRRLRPQIDRLFFKERYALDHGIAELLPALATCAGIRELTQRAGAGLERLLRPEACVVYARSGQSYVPVFEEGRAVPLAFEAEGPLIASLRERRAPLALDGFGRRRDGTALSPFDRATLETLRAEVVVPVHQGEALTAFLCLGPKRSGDLYTSTDLSLLSAVAEKVSAELRRFEQDELIREGREMQESLRRYVPGAVAEQLTGGGQVASSEREVSVLFVDIRGYTSFSEDRRAEEIFSTVNRYTETVSRIVQSHSGSVVEFNGDGMMSVFGAPRELAHKERAAVEAGLEIVKSVDALMVEDDHGRTKLSVGVGIATGSVFVGNIQAADRMIWTAVGNTTNLAARLQTLTRSLDAAVVIDADTREAAGPAAQEFEKRPGTKVRGRREALDCYALPLRSVPLWPRDPAIGIGAHPTAG